MVSRFIVDWSFTPFWNQKNLYTKANQLIWESIESFNSIGKLKDYKLLVIFQPIEWELINGTEYKFEEIKYLCKQNSVNYIDLREEFKEMNIEVGTNKGSIINKINYLLNKNKIINNKINPSKLYWPIDYHFNNYGYSFFAKAIVDEIENYYEENKKENN